MPSTYASPRAVSLVVFTDMAIVRREISSSISYTASFLGTICLEVPSPIPTVFFLHLTVALQRRTVYDFLISGHLLPDSRHGASLNKNPPISAVTAAIDG